MNKLTTIELKKIEIEKLNLTKETKPQTQKKVLRLNILYQELTDILPDHMLIYQYAELLQRDLNLYSPEKAFIWGKYAKSKTSDKIMLLEYIISITNNDLQTNILTAYLVISDLLSELGADTKLISEFTNLYKEIYGIICDSIDIFLEMGYNS